jgi:hypothetical protein
MTANQTPAALDAAAAVAVIRAELDNLCAHIDALVVSEGSAWAAVRSAKVIAGSAATMERQLRILAVSQHSAVR